MKKSNKITLVANVLLAFALVMGVSLKFIGNDLIVLKVLTISFFVISGMIHIFQLKPRHGNL